LFTNLTDLTEPSMANIPPSWLFNGNWNHQTDNRLNDLEAFKASATPRLADLDKFKTSATSRFGKLECFEKTAGQSLVELRKFEGDALNRLGKLEKFKEKEFTPWKNDTDKRLGVLEKKKGDSDEWKNKVDGLLGGLEKGKLGIDVYNADKTKVNARLDELEDFKGRMGAIFSRDQSKNETRLDTLEQRVKGLEEKTTATDTKIDNSLKEVTDRLGKAEKKSEECCKSVKLTIKELGEKVEDNKPPRRGTMTDDPSTRGTSEPIQPRPSTPIHLVLPIHRNPFPSHFPAITPFTPFTPPPSPPPSTSHSHHVHHHHHHRSRRHGGYYYHERDEEDRMYNMQQMPAIHLGFSRTTPGGVFSRGKKDRYQFSIGGGGGLMGSGKRRGSLTASRI